MIQAIILAGGLGTRMAEYTKTIPKPMIKIGKKPMIEHIMEHYNKFGVNDFIIAGGYKYEVIKKYLNSKKFNYKVKLVYTGKESLTGGRLKRLEKFVLNDDFFLTYGDGISNINIKKLYNFHKLHRKIATVSAVHPVARFGELNLRNNLVLKFKEKPQVASGWINGGFFVFKKKIFKYLKNDQTILEKRPLEMLSKERQLLAFKHEGFWQCVDTKRERDVLDKTLRKYSAFR
jgi:glucose-1-phosphate cytidylyltransferase|tara:strand:- start:28038 stop:28733 length:696 start_codon:yes stop_codon:yes gene_type:complete